MGNKPPSTKTNIIKPNKSKPHIKTPNKSQTKKDKQFPSSSSTPQQSPSIPSSIQPELSLSLFDIQYVIGRGGFGKVFKVQMKNKNQTYALKQISKAKIIDKKSEKSIKNERDILSKINHPFIINMHYSFQDKENLYIVFDYLTGGDLRYHLSKTRRFSEEQTKFFVACLLLGIEYLHTNSIIHRDVKPENLILDNKGYLRITDFGIAKAYRNDAIGFETSGTPGYMSPEVMRGKSNTFAVDFFAIGVLTYEFMIGSRPFVGNRRELKDKIIKKQIHIKQSDIPKGWSFDVADFVVKLLQKTPANRLGLSSALEVKSHPWLRNFQWKELYMKKMEAPFMPKEEENYDKKYCELQEILDTDTRVRYQEINRKNNHFLNFDFYRKDNGERYRNDIGDNAIEYEFVNLHEKGEMLDVKGNGGEEGKLDSVKIERNFAKVKFKAVSDTNAKLLRSYKNEKKKDEEEEEEDEEEDDEEDFEMMYNNILNIQECDDEEEEGDNGNNNNYYFYQKLLH